MEHEVLLDPAHTVPPVPYAERGVAWLRFHVARFSEGADHVRRRDLAVSRLSTVDLAALRRPGHAVAKLACALGLPRTVVPDVAVVARSYQPHTPVTDAADEAVRRLVAVCGGAWDEETAALIGLLVQASAAMEALIAGKEPPVPATRRIAPDGAEVLVDLAEVPFGAGRHGCPAREHAQALAEGTFHRLHHGPEPLVLPNAWDFASAAALVQAGFTAIGTTSLGVASAAGIPDAAGVAREETLALARKLVRLPVPVTVDVEAGFGDVRGLAAELADLGVAGVNIEDGRGDGLADPVEQAELVRAFKETAPHLFVNARVDTHWLHVDQGSTVERALRYVEAGADGIFVPGLVDPAEITAVVAAVPVPLNVLAQRDIRELAELGVRRVSTGSLLFRAALHATVATAQAVRDGAPVGEVPGYDEVQRLSEL
ncbi:isocitrate lyase/phosphoenolpyruvate mutase family protein [Actinosynnema sp. NPDC047251]|uniref:PEP phosphonomutase-like protein n=1 Tax=Saccharothrix espanaensis (strain ATCC 51144 / DSM 44229 / JCM 9112 / NBRC 15066 / NRRL 15764) TaxID=1179773 RepID=K0KDR3_SACES|nr:isocitrate lyase/phosphoenolpyruvate mutase family protein [Saccharothrix espanaensis]CCH34663.1 PEP phosphonomutase-like protein [Saccharothrix espanaensis DSM 44229]